MQIIRHASEMQETAEKIRLSGRRIGIVPTMGFLHQGHLSLIARAKENSDVVVTTIFVNPTQFGPGEDLERYPRNFERDEKLAREAGTDILFYPDAKEMYPAGYLTYVGSERVSTMLEGKFRPTHFRGVTTVVAKLLNIVKPHVALFGQKDAQQAFIIRQMVKDLNFDVSVTIAPIVREQDGLALSSRNVYLSPSERSNATVLFRSLKLAEQRITEGIRNSSRIRKEMEEVLRSANPSAIDYVAFLRPDDFAETDAVAPPSVLIALAVRFGTTRLIDNIIVSVN
ncbi:MAG: pantoate--beta-alanine ligase [Bacteroidota bacterium]